MSESNGSRLSSVPHKFRHRLEFALFNCLKRWGVNASAKTLRRGVILLDFLLYHVLRICRRIVAINLELAYPDLSAKDRYQRCKTSHLAKGAGGR